MRFLLLLGLIGSISCYDFNDFYTMSEGDIVQVKPLPGIENSALAAPEFRWPKAELPYQISNGFSDSDKKKIRDALNEIQQKTCVRFRDAKDSDTDRVLVVKKDGCYSYIGRVGKLQELSLGNGCMYTNTIQHEFMHALGFVHEQTRADRDDYVEIVWANVEESQKHNFDKRKYEDLTLMDTPYTYSSIMHYGDDAFARIRGQKTMIAKKPTNNMGKSDHLTDIDADRIRRLYCPDKPVPPPPTTIEGFNFQKGGGGIMWSNGCDFVGRDIGDKKIEAKDCGDYCARNPKCSHFTWTPNDGGVCYIKAGFAPDAKPQRADSSFVCGYRGPTSSQGSWNKGGQGTWWSNGCDFPGRDITTVKIKPELCSDECVKNKDCTHFAWTPTDGGTCYLKKDHQGKPQCAPYFYVCGYIGRIGNGGPMLCT